LELPLIASKKCIKCCLISKKIVPSNGNQWLDQEKHKTNLQGQFFQMNEIMKGTNNINLLVYRWQWNT
jgi:hypothetical protein